MLRRLLAAVAAVLFICAGCDKESKSGSPGLTKVVLQLNWKPEPEFGGFYAAQLNGHFAKHGLDVEINPGGASAPTIEMVGAGTVPFAIVNGDEIVRARSKGNLVTAPFAVYQTNPQGIMTQAARGFRTIEDIFTHPGTLAMERGLPYSDFLQQKYGFDKVKIVPSPYGNLSLYRVDPTYSMQCFVTSEPLAAKKIGVEPQTFLIAEAGYNPYTTVLATNDAYLKSNPAIVKEMIQAVREGWQEYLANPDKTNVVMAKLNQTMDAETFKASAEAQKGLILNESTDGSDLGMMSALRWQTLIQQLLNLKSIDKPVPADECFTNGK